MRGNFEVENSAYPVAALPDGNGRYFVTCMIGLDRLHDEPIHHEAASEIARRTNDLHRKSRETGWRGHGLSPEVLTYAKARVDMYQASLIE